MSKYLVTVLTVLMCIGCVIALPILMGHIMKQLDEFNNKITGENNPIYGDKGIAVITLKEKIPTRSILISEYYLISENNTFYACNDVYQYIDPVIGHHYQIEWYYSGGYRIESIQEVDIKSEDEHG